MSSSHHFHPIRLKPLTHEDIKRRRDLSNDIEQNYRIQTTGAYYQLDRNVLKATGKHTPITPPNFTGDVTNQPTMQLSPSTERVSDSYDMTSIKQAKSLRLMIEKVTEMEGRLPHAIRLHPFAAAVLALTDICSSNEQGSKYIFYAGVIPLETDVSISVTKLILTWNDPFLQVPFDFFTS
jgi:hypothetical protein